MDVNNFNDADTLDKAVMAVDTTIGKCSRLSKSELITKSLRSYGLCTQNDQNRRHHLSCGLVEPDPGNPNHDSVRTWGFTGSTS